jgi:hypothetical protein
MPNIRWIAVIAFLLLSVGVDFSSKLISIAADGLIIGAALMIAWPMIKNQNKDS